MGWLTSYFSSPQTAPVQNIKVELRAASYDEIKSEKKRVQNQGRFWSIVTYAWNQVTNAVNTIALVKLDLRTLFGLYINKDPYLSVCRFMNRTVHLTKHPRIMDAIFALHRNDPQGSLFTIAEDHPTALMLRKYYKEFNIAYEDIILLCSPEGTKKYRAFLHQYFLKMNLQAYLEKIQEEVEKSVRTWDAQAQPLNVTEATRIFACGVMAKIFLGLPGPYENICRASTVTIAHISEIFLKKYKIPPSQIDDAIKILKEAVQISIANKNVTETLVSHMLSNDAFTDIQTRIMVFILLIAGQDNSATSLTYSLLKLAQHTELQDSIYDELRTLRSRGKSHIEACMDSNLLKALMAESLRMMTPVSGLGRVVAKDSVLVIKNESDVVLKQYYIPAATQGANDVFLSGMPTYAAREQMLAGPEAEEFRLSRWKENDVPSHLPNLPWRPLGSGKHTCPGWPLFNAEAMLLLGTLLIEHRLSTTQKGEPAQKSAFTNKLANDVFVRFEKRT